MIASETVEQTYTVDASHSSVEFVVRHMMIAKVRGRFAAVTGSFTVAAGERVPTRIDATIDASSIVTGDAQRDAHLTSPDFFDVATHPQIAFTSTKIAAADGGFALHGNLTMHGKTLPIVLDATYEGESTDLYGNRRIGFEAHGKLSRKDFGLTWNAALETGGVAVSDEVKLELSVEGVLAS